MEKLLHDAWTVVVEGLVPAIKERMLTGLAALVLAPFALLGVVLWRSGWARRVRAKWRLRHYARRIRNTCNRLPVIGRGEHFALEKVYVPLDIRPSEFSRSTFERGSGVYGDDVVVLGSPGAGKSTYVKKLALDALRGRQHVVLFYRLKSYSGGGMLDALLADIQSAAPGVTKEHLTETLRQCRVLCVLDALDEVRHQYRDEAAKEINRLHSNHFQHDADRQLIVTCRKEAYRDIPLNITDVRAVQPTTDHQIKEFAQRWPFDWGEDRSPASFWEELCESESVLEVARTPLLLVGALLQYTAGQGSVQQERHVYMARMFEWLLTEWRERQGHPAQKYEEVWRKALPRFAYHMQEADRDELTRAEAIELIAEWGPDWGVDTSEAEAVVDGLREQTGMMERQPDGRLVFACRPLQEHCCSIRTAEVLRPRELASWCADDRWQEVILLAVPQLSDPQAHLNALMDADPIIGCLAVAECATPPLPAQDRALHLALGMLNSEAAELTRPLVALLRRLSGDREQLLCGRLAVAVREWRSHTAAEALAQAGTTAATATLAQDPSLWRQVFTGETGYSRRFETHLLRLVREGTDAEFDAALAMLGEGGSSQAVRELTELLRDLAQPRARAVGAALLSSRTSLLEEPTGGLRSDWRDQIRQAATAAFYAKRPPQAGGDPVRTLCGVISAGPLGCSPSVVRCLATVWLFRRQISGFAVGLTVGTMGDLGGLPVTAADAFGASADLLWLSVLILLMAAVWWPSETAGGRSALGALELCGMVGVLSFVPTVLIIVYVLLAASPLNVRPAISALCGMYMALCVMAVAIHPYYVNNVLVRSEVGRPFLMLVVIAWAFAVLHTVNRPLVEPADVTVFPSVFALVCVVALHAGVLSGLRRWDLTVSSVDAMAVGGGCAGTRRVRAHHTRTAN